MRSQVLGRFSRGLTTVCDWPQWYRNSNLRQHGCRGSDHVSSLPALAAALLVTVTATSSHRRSRMVTHGARSGRRSCWDLRKANCQSLSGDAIKIWATGMFGTGIVAISTTLRGDRVCDEAAMKLAFLLVTLLQQLRSCRLPGPRCGVSRCILRSSHACYHG